MREDCLSYPPSLGSAKNSRISAPRGGPEQRKQGPMAMQISGRTPACTGPNKPMIDFRWNETNHRKVAGLLERFLGSMKNTNLIGISAKGSESPESKLPRQVPILVGLWVRNGAPEAEGVHPAGLWDAPGLEPGVLPDVVQPQVPPWRKSYVKK